MVVFRTIQLVVCFISLVSCFFVMLTFASVKQLRQFPNTLAFYRTFCDFIFALQFAILNVSGTVQNLDDQSSACKWYVAATEIGLLGSASWYFAQSHYVFTSTKNPFQRPEKRYATITLPPLHI